MSTKTPGEPVPSTAAPAALFADYLAWYREKAIDKVASLPPQEQRRPILPSGWTPLEMLQHLAFMERRWLVWGFLGEDVPDPWGDEVDGRWHVPDEVTFDAVATMMQATGERVTATLADTPLDRVAQPGPRFAGGDLPALGWICFHVLQEYARHLGHLDVVVELAGGPTGE
jgi:uncharacterized damage-inducible protein DinB